MSGWGMRVKRNGVVEQEPFTNLGRVLAVVETGTTDGYYDHDGLLTGTPQWVIQMASFGHGIPTVSVSGNRLSWTFPTVTGAAQKVNCYIIMWVR